MQPQRGCGKGHVHVARPQPLQSLFFSVTSDEQDERSGFQDGADPHGDRLVWDAAVLEKRGVGDASRFSQLHDPGSRIEGRSGLVESDVPVAAKTQEREVEATGCSDVTLIPAAFFLEVRRHPIRDMRPCGADVSMIEEVLPHECVVTAGMVARDTDVLVEVERRDVAKAPIVVPALADDAVIHADGSAPGGKTKDQVRSRSGCAQKNVRGAVGESFVTVERLPDHEDGPSTSSLSSRT